jgi:hypothetical protein
MAADMRLPPPPPPWPTMIGSMPISASTLAAFGMTRIVPSATRAPWQGLQIAEWHLRLPRRRAVAVGRVGSGAEAALSGCFRECRNNTGTLPTAAGIVAANTFNESKITNLFTVGPRWATPGTDG